MTMLASTPILPEVPHVGPATTATRAVSRLLDPIASGRAARLLLATLFALAAAAPAWAQRSHFHLYDQNHGLDAGEIIALAQDNTGFVWIGTHRGLLRFDGREFVGWAPQQLDGVVLALAYGPADELLIRMADGRVLRRTQQGVESLPVPPPTVSLPVASVDFDRNGGLWAVIGTQLWWRDRAQRWQRVDAGLVGGEAPRRVSAVDDGVIVFTADAAWRLHGPQDSAEEVLRAPDLWLAAGGGDHALWLTGKDGRTLWRIDASGVQGLQRPSGRAIDLRQRGNTLWLALDRELLAYEPDGRVRVIDIADGLPSGGPLLVDRERSLWLGTFAGLAQFPEPDTWQWSEREGLPSAHAYSLAEAGGQFWVSTWRGLAHLDAGRKPTHLSTDTAIVGRACVDAQHRAWVSDGRRLLVWHRGRFQPAIDFPATAPVGLHQCAFDSHGALWLATSDGLLRLEPGAISPRRIALTPPGGVDLVWFEADGGGRVADARTICRLDPTGPDTAGRGDCQPIAATWRLLSHARISAEHAWITAADGIFDFDGHSAVRLAGNRLLTGGVVHNLTAAPGGDWWAAGPGALLRLRPCTGCEAGWSVQEQPGLWQGLPGNTAMEALETDTGELWMAGNRGVWRVPHAARAVPTQAPQVVAVHARVDGRRLASNALLEIAPGLHRLDLEFAALSFRDRSLLRFRSRLDSAGAWSNPTREPVLQLVGLEPGTWRAEMAASLDGRHWSASPAVIEFTALPPWYRTWWAHTLLVLLGLGLLALAYRLRVAALLRVERERARIAMDLHDELGAGLGSIGVLAGVAAREGVDADERRRLAVEIASVAGLLGGGLRSLVWSLRSGRAGVAELGAQLADHARRLFPGDCPRLSVRLPVDPPSASLAPELRRHVLLLALEALHNVARHAQATHVMLTLAWHAEGGLHLLISDDGRGFDACAPTAGTGIEGMQRRAAAIGARLRVDSAPGTGTRVTLDHGPGNRDGLA